MPADLVPTVHRPPSFTNGADRRPAGTTAWTLVRGPIGVLLLFVAATFAVYSPVLGGEFLWDDNYLVRGNGLIRSPVFCLEIFRHTLFGGESNFYRPVQTLTYLWDYLWWGLNPYGYHLTNVLVHAANGFLLYTLLRRLLPELSPSARENQSATNLGALALSLLWVLHPAHSAAVAYVAGRADSLAMLSCLSAWLLCERALEPGPLWMRAAAGVGAFVCFVAGLCSKEIALVWLGLFVGWLFAVRPRTGWLTSLLALGGGLLAVGVAWWLRHLPPAAPAPPLPPGTLSRWTLMLRALGDYGRLLVFPDRLYMERQVFAAPGLANPADPAYYSALTVTGAALLAVFVLGTILPGRGRRLRRAGVAWFLVGFLPVSNLLPLNASVAEHWLYLPSIGFLLLLAGVALDVPWSRLPPALVRPGVAAVVVLVAVLALGERTWLRAHDWVDGLTFYRQTIRDGGDFPRMREGLALACLEHGDLDTAGRTLESLVAERPQLFSARVNLATVRLRTGHEEEGRGLFEGLATDLATATDRRAGPGEIAATIRALDRLEPPGNMLWADQRRLLLDRTIGRFAASWDLLRIRIADREKAGDLPAALDLANGFSAAQWWHAPARAEIGRLLAASGRTNEALESWQEAARLDIYDADAPAAAAAVCLAHERLDEALVWQQTAVHRQPGSLRQHLLLARVLERCARPAEAAHERSVAAGLANAGNR